MKDAVTDEELSFIDGCGVSFKIGPAAAGFFENHGARSDIPGLEGFFVESIEATGSDIADVEGGGAGSPESHGGEEEAFKDGQSRIDVFHEVNVEAGTDEGFIQCGGAGDVNGFAVEVSAAAPDGVKEFIAGGIIDHSEEELFFPFKSEGNGEVGIPVDEIHRPIEGVENPSPVAFGRAEEPRFLGEDLGFRIEPEEAPGEVGFDGQVDFCYRVFGSTGSFKADRTGTLALVVMKQALTCLNKPPPGGFKSLGMSGFAAHGPSLNGIKV